MTLIIGIATLTLMLKTPKTLAKWCRVNYSFKSVKNLSTQLAGELVSGLEYAQGSRLASQIASENEALEDKGGYIQIR